MKILQLNLNHCQTAHDLLMQTVYELKPDLVMISEPYKYLNSQYWVTNNRDNAVIWSCGKQPLQDIVYNIGNCAVRAKFDGIYYYSCYAPPSLTMDEFLDFLDQLIDDAKSHNSVAIAGDFNAWATEWGSRKTNARGQALLEAMSLLDVVLLNDGDKPTYERDGSSSIVDLTFVSSNLCGNYTWEVMDNYTASDHRAIYWTLNTGRKTRLPINKINAIGWKTSAFDPTLFKLAFDCSAIRGRDAKEKVDDIMGRVAEACDITMPRKCRAHRHLPVYWWNSTIAALRRDCIRARRLSQRSRYKPSHEEMVTKYKEARRKLGKAIKISKGKCWDELLQEVEDDPWGRPYTVVKARLRNKQMALPTCPEFLKRIVTELFPPRPELDFSIERYEITMIPPVTKEELILACRRFGNAKAPGPDGIPNIVLKDAISAVPELFLDVYNTCLQEGIFPAKWKKQRLVLLPKGQKPPDEPSSYRPLCMLDTAGKILERIIHGRIETVIEDKLSDSQHGFRRKHSTVDAINRVVSVAREAISGQRWKGGTKKYCLMVALDIKNAFNSAKWDCIMQALNNMNVPGYLRRIVGSYLTDRILQYDTEDGPREYKVTGGVPQGSVLGPILWNIMYDELLKLKLPEGAELIAFADDVALLIVAKYLEEIKFLFAEIFGRIRQCLEGMGLKLAEQKTEAVLFTGRKQMEYITLQMGNHELTSLPSIRYLGVIIDARLNFKKQSEYASNKASIIRSTLSRLMPNVGGPKQARRVLLSSVITSVLMYGIVTWADALKTQESRRKVASVYRLSVLRVASAYRTVSEDAVCVIAGMLPIEVLAEERKSLYQQRGTTDAVNLRTVVRTESIKRWQQRWDASSKGRWTYRLIPQIDTWNNRHHGEVNYYITQMLSGHGCFRAYLHRFKHEDSPECPTCPGINEDAEHVFFVCPRFNAARRDWEIKLGGKMIPEDLVKMMLATKEAWEATSSFAAVVLKELRRMEQQRKKDREEEKLKEEFKELIS